jgi:hypothetical protein
MESYSSDDFLFTDKCSYCRKIQCHYPFKLYGTSFGDASASSKRSSLSGIIAFFYTCTNCIDKAWDHYHNYKSCDSWEFELKAKTNEDFLNLLTKQRNECIKVQLKMAAKREIEKTKTKMETSLLDNFLFTNKCSYCGVHQCHYAFRLHGTIAFFYTCKNCINKAWDHYHSYTPCGLWKFELKAKTNEDFLDLLVKQRNECINKYFKLITAREIEKTKKEMEIIKYQKKNGKQGGQFTGYLCFG